MDTSFFFAGIVPADGNHKAATTLGERLAGRTLVTTNHVRGETWTLLRRKEDHRVAVAFLDGLEHSVASVATVGKELELEALAWLRRHDERAYSFVDATSFAYMRRHSISEVLTFDGDFAAAGFVELRPD